MKVWVLRHGEAEGHARTDAERNLTAHGREEVLRSAGHLIGQPVRAIIASPYVRAQQTAQLVREALGFEPEIRTVPWLTPESNPLEVLKHLDNDDDVLLVSHQPFVGADQLFAAWAFAAAAGYEYGEFGGVGGGFSVGGVDESFECSESLRLVWV